MTCSRLLTTMGSSQRRSIRDLVSASTAKEGARIRGIVTRSLPSTASSSSSTSSPTRVLMSPLIVNQDQSHHPNLLFLGQPHQQQQHDQQQHTPSIVTNVAEFSTQQNSTSSSTSNLTSTSTTKTTTQLPPHNVSNRQAHSHAAAHRLVARKKKPTACGWKKPIVSSSLALSSYVEPTNPDDATAPATADDVSISLSPQFEPSSPISENTVGVDMEELLKLASKKTTPLSLKDMYKYAIVDADNREQRIRNAQFLHSE